MTGELDLKDHLFSSWCITQNLSICVCGAKVTLDLSRATFCAVWAVWKECHLFTHDLYYPVSTFDSFGAVQN